jgi:glycosyltransferase involved in cell wall biosynthesis
MRSLRIGINALYLIPGGVGGTEIYLRSLLAALAELQSPHRFILFTNKESGNAITPDHPSFETVACNVRATVRPARILWEQLVLPLEATRRRLDVLLNPGFTAPLVRSCPNVTVFHDLQHLRHPEYFRWWDLPFWRLLLWQSVHSSRSLVAVSDETRRDLEKYYRVEVSRVRTVPHGVDDVFFAIGAERREQTPDKVVLCVSTLHPHKNLDRLIIAFSVFRESRPSYRLVIAGMEGFSTEDLRALVRSSHLETSVELTGWIPREQLNNLFRTADAFVYPTRFEGFGMPLLEALAAGLPTACSDIEPLRSIAGDAVLRFDPESDIAILQALQRLTSDARLREQLQEAGPRRAALFSWRESAKATLEVLERAAQIPDYA